MQVAVSLRDRARRTQEWYKAERRLAIARARENIHDFIEYVMLDPQRNSVRQSGCHVLLQEHIERNRFALGCFPRDHGKTTQVVARILFELGRNPNLRFKIVSADDDMATKRVQAVKRYIDYSKRLAEVFPHLRRNETGTNWSDRTITVARTSLDLEPSLDGRGILSTVVGSRCDILVADDVCDFANSVASGARRKAVKVSFFDAWINCLTPDGRVWYVYTPWHQDDLSADLERKAADPENPWTLLRLPVEELGGRLIPVWPEHWGEEQLRHRRLQVGPLSFARAMKLLAVDDSTCPLLPYIPLMLTTTQPSWLWEEGREKWPRVMGVDPAIRRNKKSSETAIITAAIEPNGRRWLDPDFCFVGNLSSPETARMLVQFWQRTQAEVIYVENNVYQEALLEWIAETVPGAYNIPIEGWTTTNQKKHPEIGIPGIAAEIARGAHAFPCGSSPIDETGERDVISKLCKQAREWPLGDKDDAMMGWWICGQAARSLGDVIDSSQELEEKEDDWLLRERLDGGSIYDDDFEAGV